MTDARPNPMPRYIVPAVLAVVAFGVVGLYGFGGSGNKESAACPGAAAVSARLAPLAKGEVAALNVQTAPQPLVPLIFKKPDGSGVALADFKGRTVLLNLWATWCVPCRKEMPALDALQTALGSEKFEVVAVNIDQRNTERVGTFLDEIGVKALTRYADETTGIFVDLKKAGKAIGMPTTLLVDPNGCELARLEGPAEWASAEAKAVIAEAVK